MDEKALRTEVQKLIEKFERVKAQGKYKSYNEENTKKDFILPLFRILGWNVDDSEEVKAEEKVSKKRVDYAFRIDGVVKFYLEAKPLREYLTEPKYAKQAIEYAWNKSVTWAILCNFEGIRVFNAEWKWDEKSPMRNSFLDLRYTDFLNSSFKYLTWLSRESFEQGILDKNAAILGKKTKKLPIDKQLLADFTEYRNILTKDILKHNQLKKLSQDNLDEIVQRILDRLIFIRTCEDKEIESEKLESLTRMYGDKEGDLYIELNKKFREYDEGYNSKLFREHLCEDVIVSNDVLKQVILGTYQTRDLSIAYDFSAIGADVLGNIYEQYLGHILKKTPQRAKLTNGKAHRKEQGIFYTPTYIVDYIVQNTVREKLKQRMVKIDELKILDPACGSGSFLLKAFDVICEHETKKEGKTLQTKFEDISVGKLLKRKTELLKNCIFGIDLDPQAVEIAQLNLLLKLAEKRYRLPTLQENIQIGDSLIDDSDIAGNKAFKWKEKFKEIMETGGFDIVIGNPPYIQKSYQVDEKEKKYLIEKYGSSMGRLNTFGFFIKLGIDLLKDGGRLGFIVPNTILTQDYYEELRKNILDSTKIESIVTFFDLPFKDAVVENTVIILKKEKSDKLRSSNDIKIVSVNEQHDFIEKNSIKQTIFGNTHKNSFNIYIDNKLLSLQNKIRQDTEPLENIVEINQAIALRHDRSLWVYDKKLDDNYKPLLVGGKNINRYQLSWDGSYLKYDIKGIHSCKREDIFLTSEKVLFRRVDKNLIATLDTDQFYALHTLNVMNLKHNVKYYLRYILALFNSGLMNFYYKTYYKSTKRVFSEVEARQVAELPIKIISKENQQPFVVLVDKMLSLNKRLNEVGDKKTDERARIEEEIKNIDAEIDQLVYKLYGLTKEEISIVEGSPKA